VVPLEAAAAGELSALARGPGGEAALWAIERLGSLQDSGALVELTHASDRARAEAAVRALAQLPGAAPLLARALARAGDEASAHALAEALDRLQPSPKEIALLRAAAAKALPRSLAV